MEKRVRETESVIERRKQKAERERERERPRGETQERTKGDGLAGAERRFSRTRREYIERESKRKRKKRGFAQRRAYAVSPLLRRDTACARASGCARVCVYKVGPRSGGETANEYRRPLAAGATNPR